jgi:hypothetical protein
MTSLEQIEDWREEFRYKIDIYANQLEMLVEYHIREAVKARTQEVEKVLERLVRQLPRTRDNVWNDWESGYYEATQEILKALSPEVKDDSK